MSSIRDLATIVAKRSRLVSEQSGNENQEHKLNVEDSAETRNANLQNVALRAMPLPDLANTLALHQDWLSNLYNAHVYLKNRAPVNPFQLFYGSHTASLVQHSHTQRAAIIATAAIEFRTLIDANQVKVDMLNERPLCMDPLDWMFNASRAPHVGVDEMRQFPGHDYMVVMRRGHYFKVDLKTGSQIVPYSSLLAIIQGILEQPLSEVASIAALTVGNGDTWAQEYWMQPHSSCAWIPHPPAPLRKGAVNSSTRSFSQWSDKTLQFVVCPNGVSAYICEHAAIDGGILGHLDEKIQNAVLEHGIDQQPNTDTHTNGVFNLQPLTFNSSLEVDTHICSAQKLHSTFSVSTDYHFYRCNLLGGSFLRSHGCAPKSGFQVIIQLAALS
ncbi:MAG: hypothetical protein Q9181_007554 [Wetmoreana brouardii]